jgi:hypothetical protein
MKKITSAFVFSLLVFISSARAQSDDRTAVNANGYSRKTLATMDAVRVKRHSKKNGTYVEPRYRNAADDSKQDNWSRKGNVNSHKKRGRKKLGDYIAS